MFWNDKYLPVTFPERLLALADIVLGFAGLVLIYLGGLIGVPVLARLIMLGLGMG